MESKLGLIIQIAGVSVITLLTAFLRRSLNLSALKHWTNAWLCQCFALFCLRLAFSYDEYSLQLLSFFLLTQYFFGFLLVAGCRNLAIDEEIKPRQEIFAVVFILLGFGLPFVFDDLNLLMHVHSLLLCGFFVMAFLSLMRITERTFGWYVLQIAIGLSFLNMLQEFGGYFLHIYRGIDLDLAEFTPVADVVLQILLGFGMVILLLEKVLAEARSANEHLLETQEKLLELANVDSLTTALNRHAFNGYVERHSTNSGSSSGCVGFFDIDDLKDINDVHGHVAGDIVIRAVVKAIRSVTRPDDLIFRWGGDEFFVLMMGLDAESAAARMPRMERLLTKMKVNGVPQPVTVNVSFAFENFSTMAEIENAIQIADANMYLNKQQRKAERDEIRNVEDYVEYIGEVRLMS
ncbi:MAG: GGDEF domain-containing protein [Acidobacteria bacterium]|nr:GGDEF domain-containing protein [Acidobacteriota bacterium]MCW5948096.1 GGDEF domain-containing protein [Pyrinomonadaceae bacterium]